MNISFRACTALVLLGIALTRLGAAAHTAQPNVAVVVPGSNWYDVRGDATNGMQPTILIGREYSGTNYNWSYDMSYIAQTNFSRNEWISITNRADARLVLWDKDGQKIPLKDRETAAAASLPLQTTVKDIKRGVPRSRATLLWLHFERDPKQKVDVAAGQSAWVTSFNLGTAFASSFTNDMVLELTPLLYRVNTNIVNAKLVEFPPIKLKLHANGEVEKVD